MEMTDFQKTFLSRGTGGKLFTQKEFDDALEIAKTEIMTFAIMAAKEAAMIEREACAKMADECTEELGEAIRNRIPAQRQ